MKKRIENIGEICRKIDDDISKLIDAKLEADGKIDTVIIFQMVEARFSSLSDKEIKEIGILSLAKFIEQRLINFVKDNDAGEVICKNPVPMGKGGDA